ncbi:hypothetical protein HT031_000525 [Scenedesmus sp. PABB004]|nr:hypothetical protein HT031_000525 [Scenedesmus sp. PABB004]
MQARRAAPARLKGHTPAKAALPTCMRPPVRRRGPAAAAASAAAPMPGSPRGLASSSWDQALAACTGSASAAAPMPGSPLASSSWDRALAARTGAPPGGDAQQPLPLPARPGGGAASSEESELLWAGYSDLADQLRRLSARHEALSSQLGEANAKLSAVQAAQAGGVPAGAWQAASFLVLFLGFINLMGLLANLHLGLFLPWAAKPQGVLLVKQLLGTALPATNTAVVLIFCLQAVKAAWAVLRW